MKDKHLITVDEFKQLARPVSVHIDENEVMQYIDECEDIYIIPNIGYGNFKAAISDSTWDATFDETFKANLIVNGGEWEDEQTECGKTSKILRYCKGLKATLAYYVYAKMQKADGAIISRAGYMRHNDTYANHAADINNQYNEVMNIAETYMGGCLQYLKTHTTDKVIKPLRSTRARIKAIGD